MPGGAERFRLVPGASPYGGRRGPTDGGQCPGDHEQGASRHVFLSLPPSVHRGTWRARMGRTCRDVELAWSIDRWRRRHGGWILERLPTGRRAAQPTAGRVWAVVNRDPRRQTIFGWSVGVGELVRPVACFITSGLCHTASAVWQRVNRIGGGVVELLYPSAGRGVGGALPVSLLRRGGPLVGLRGSSSTS